MLDFKGSSETSHKLHASFTRQQVQKPNLHSSGFLSIGRIAGGKLPRVQKKARLLIYTIDGSDEEKRIMDFGPINWLAGLILVLSTHN